MDNAMDLLGKKVRDKVSEFEGTVTAVVFYLDDVPSVRVEGVVGLDGEAREKWFSHKRVEVMDEGGE